MSYKQGAIPTMMIALSSKENWKTPTVSATTPAAVKEIEVSNISNKVPTITENKQVVVFVYCYRYFYINCIDFLVQVPPPSSIPAIKKGFLSNSKGAIYGDKLTTIRPAVAKSNNNSNILLRESDSTNNNSSYCSDNINLSNSSNIPAAQKKNANKLVQEVQPGDKIATTNMSTANVAGNKSSILKNHSGLTELSTKLKEGSTIDVTATNSSSHGSSGNSTIKAQAAAAAAMVTTQNKSTNIAGTVVDDNSPPSSGQVAATSSAIETAAAVPVYTVKERGHISVGDFEAVNNNSVATGGSAKSNR